MYLPPLQPITNSELYVCGDVDIHPSAAIAAGVILKAAPNSRIVIGEGVCLGMGTILNACFGDIEIENGAVLGAGVLIVGTGKIGRHACIGAATTIFNASVRSMSSIAGGSLLGDLSRQVEMLADPETENVERIDREISSTPPEIFTESATLLEEENAPSEPESAKKEETKVSEEKLKVPIVGQIYINQLLLTLFPQGQSSKRPHSNNDRE